MYKRQILYRWRDWADEKEVKQWVQEVIKDDEALVTFLEKFLKRTLRQFSTDVVTETVYRLDPQWLKPFIEPNQIIERVKVLAENNKLSESQKVVLRQFIREYEIRQQGMEPDSVYEDG